LGAKEHEEDVGGLFSCQSAAQCALSGKEVDHAAVAVRAQLLGVLVCGAGLFVGLHGEDERCGAGEDRGGAVDDVGDGAVEVGLGLRGSIPDAEVGRCGVVAEDGMVERGLQQLGLRVEGEVERLNGDAGAGGDRVQGVAGEPRFLKTS